MALSANWFYLTLLERDHRKSADRLEKKTAHCLKSLPLFVTDGLKFYKIALLKQYGMLQSFVRTGERGRPRLSKLIPNKLLKYALIIKHRPVVFLRELKRE
jgi:hypothetical protein